MPTRPDGSLLLLACELAGTGLGRGGRSPPPSRLIAVAPVTAIAAFRRASCRRGRRRDHHRRRRDGPLHRRSRARVSRSRRQCRLRSGNGRRACEAVFTPMSPRKSWIRSWKRSWKQALSAPERRKRGAASGDETARTFPAAAVPAPRARAVATKTRGAGSLLRGVFMRPNARGPCSALQDARDPWCQ